MLTYSETEPGVGEMEKTSGGELETMASDEEMEETGGGDGEEWKRTRIL